MAQFAASVLLLLCVTASWAQNGQQASRIIYKDYKFPKYAQPWTIGQNVCAYLKDSQNSQIYTTCFPYQQMMLGRNTKFVYNCCPGFMEDSAYENYRGIWQYNLRSSMRTNCLKKVSAESTVASELGRLQVDSGVVNYINKANVGNQQVTYFVETGNSFKSSKYNSKVASEVPGGHIAKGIYRVKHLANGEVLKTLAGANEQLKITRYSNGIICIDCARVVSVNHPAKNAIIHFVDRHIFNKKGKSTADTLQSKYAYFWSSVPKEVKTALSGNKCGKWYTVFVPSQNLWDQKTRGLNPQQKAKLAKAHIVSSLICTGAVVKTSRTTRNLNNENLYLGATPAGGRWVRLGMTSQQYTANFKKINGEFELMTTNGVIYEIDNLIEYSGIIKVFKWKYIVEEWRNYLTECIQLDAAKRYIFLVPTRRGLDWFLRGSDFTFNDEERLTQFRRRFKTDAEYRCYVAKYHVLEVTDKKTSLNDFWSQFFSKQRGHYQSLAFHKTYKERVSHLDLFMNQDDASQLIWQYSYARDFKAFPVLEGHVYEIDFVNIPPEEKAMDFLQRRPDVAQFYKLISSTSYKAKLHVKRKPVQLILAFANGNFRATKLKWNLEDFLGLHWVDLYFWIGDLGYLAPGERTMVGSGLNNVTLFVYRTKTSNEYYVWWQKAGTSFTMQEARQRWVKIIMFNYWKLDSMVWILQSPLQCNPDICRKIQKLTLSYFAGVGCDQILGASEKSTIQTAFKREISEHQNSLWASPVYEKRFPSFLNSNCFGRFEIAYTPILEDGEDRKKIT